MREIKFRAWDNGDIQGEGLTPEMYFFDLKSDNRWIMERKCPVMQYTGFKDKNGKEIYEGDIYVYYTYNLGIPETLLKGAVTWLCGSWHITDTARVFSYRGVGEVIGNIYENPELLTN